jgi:hypothetical protein
MELPSDKLTVCHGKSQSLIIGQSTINDEKNGPFSSMFNSYVKLPEDKRKFQSSEP